MNICIRVVQILPSKTIMACTRVPNWFERVILRIKRRRINYVGTGKKWGWSLEGSIVLKKCGWLRSLQLRQIERNMLVIAKKRKAKTLRF